MKIAKKTLAMLLCAVLTMAFAPLTAKAAGTPDTSWYNSSAKSFPLTTADQLAGLARLVNGGNTFAGKTVNLGANISLSAYGAGYNGGKGWIPIGNNWNKSFRGIFDGKNHKITGLYVRNALDYDYTGLFGSVSDGMVKNLGIKDANVAGHLNVGGLVGNIAAGTMQSCYVTGTVSYSGRDEEPSGQSDTVGGIIGYARDNSKIENCYFIGTVYGNDITGGVVGSFYQSTVQNCCAAGLVSSEWYRGSIGGVVGSFLGTLQNCYATNWVSGTVEYAGGVVGSGGGTIQNCYASGSVSGKRYVGGVIGFLLGGAVQNCAALNPSVKASPDTFTRSVGRVVGFLDEGKLSNNIAFSGMKTGGGIPFPGETTHDGRDGASKTAVALQFASAFPWKVTSSPWTYTPGKLPSLLGKTVAMPKHLYAPSSYVSMRIGFTKAIHNGNVTTIDNKGAKPFKISGRTMLPVRFIGEKMGGKVTYTNDKAPIYVKYGDITVELKNGGKTMKVTKSNGTNTVVLDVAATKQNGRVYLPLRAISQALGFDVYYEAGTEYIVVNNPKMTPEVKKERLAEAKKVIK